MNFLHDLFGNLEGSTNSSAVIAMKASTNKAPSPLQSTSSFLSSSSSKLEEQLLNLPAKG
jgi:hypothetical protein